MKKQPTLLIITNKADFTADYVVKYLKIHNLAYIRLNTEDFPLHVQSAIYPDKIFLKSPNWTLEQDDISSVWFRRPQLSNFDNQDLNENELSFARRETWTYLESLWLCLKDKKWVTRPDYLYRAEKKPLQLQIAKKVGFTIPDTIITNSSSQALDFVEKQSEIIIKPLSHGGFGENDDFSIYTTELNARACTPELFENLKISPLIIQEKIKKRSDIRLTVFGDKLHAYSVNSTHSNVDWRIDYQNVTFNKLQVPLEIKDMILEFMQILNLSFGAFDFILDENNHWIFIEVNPNGQWAWIDQYNDTTHLVESLVNLFFHV